MFVLHPQLAQDCIDAGAFPLCRLLLMNDQHYPWCILVPQVAQVGELHQLDAGQRQQLWQESDRLSRALVQAFAPDKLNIAALGNVVPQLHVHHIVRYRNDPAWPAPVWGKLPAEPYTPHALDETLTKLLRALPEDGFTRAATLGA